MLHHVLYPPYIPAKKRGMARKCGITAFYRHLYLLAAAGMTVPRLPVVESNEASCRELKWLGKTHRNHK